MSLEGRIALVTGGGRGIGRAASLALAEDGADIAIHFNRDDESARQTVSQVEALGRRAFMYQASLEDISSLAGMVEQAQSDLGTIDILINNAGIASRGRSVMRTDAAEIETLLRVHAQAPAELCRCVLPAMRDKERGDIIMVSSSATKAWNANSAPYNMGKAALEALAFGLAMEVRKYGIRVNLVAPGLVETEMGRRLIKATANVDDIRSLDPTFPFGRVCRPEDVANTIRYLVSDRSSYITGQRIYIDGGGAP